MECKINFAEIAFSLIASVDVLPVRRVISLFRALITSGSLQEEHFHGILMIVKALGQHAVETFNDSFLIVTLILVRSRKMYFSESLVPTANGYTNRRRMLFTDLLWALIFDVQPWVSFV